MKLKHFYKINHTNKQPIPGSNIKRKSSPGRFWKEILDPCCFPSEVDCTCGPRFFVQLDGLGKPIPGSLIKRFTFPKMEQGIKYFEIDWKSTCCNSILWNFTIITSTGSFVIQINGNEVVNDIIGGVNSLGEFRPNIGDTIKIIMSNTGISGLLNTLTLTGEIEDIDTEAPITEYEFIWSGQPLVISGIITSNAP